MMGILTVQLVQGFKILPHRWVVESTFGWFGRYRRMSKDYEGLTAHIIVLSCSEPPEGYERWSLRLLLDKAVELGYVDSISHEVVRTVPKKKKLNHWKEKCWVIPPEQNGSFVVNMEKVLGVYKHPIYPKNPVVCMDESPKQLIAETRVSIPPSPGQPGRHDYEYTRCGTCNIFIACEHFGKPHGKGY